MRLPIYIYTFLSLLFSLCCTAQAKEAVKLRFATYISGKPLELETRSYIIGNSKDSMTLETFRCYISSVRFYQDDKQVWAENNSYHLLDASLPESMTIGTAIPAEIQYNRVVFTMGIDSLTNAAGIAGGDMDPAKGMYWAWQSGYINMKIEGGSPVCKTRKNAFQYHLGGFLDGNACDKEVSLPVKGNARELNIYIDLAVFFEGLDMAGNSTVMIPGEEAKKLAEKAAKMFVLQP